MNVKSKPLPSLRSDAQAEKFVAPLTQTRATQTRQQKS
jgi:hypothetical protein